MSTNTVIDVASYVLDRCGTMTTMKLQKLVFYAQAQYLCKTTTPIFLDDFQAWCNGPVCYKLYEKHRGKFVIRKGELIVNYQISDNVKQIIEPVIDKLSKLTGNELSELTHNEDPWKIARGNLDPEERGYFYISKASILEYYSKHPII